MSDNYILVDSGQNVYYFDKRGLFDFLNEVGEDEEDKVNYKVLESFPLPSSWDEESVTSVRREGFDIQNHPFGNFCPFANESLWPNDAVLILKNNTIFVPKKREIKKEVISYEYSDPTPPRSTKKAAPKSKKSTTK